MASNSRGLDGKAALFGALLGAIGGGLFALSRLSKRGAVRRRDLTSFGAGSIDVEIDASMQQAKAAAARRINDAD